MDEPKLVEVADVGRTVRYRGDWCSLDPICDGAVPPDGKSGPRCRVFDLPLSIWQNEPPERRVCRCAACRPRYGPVPSEEEPRPALGRADPIEEAVAEERQRARDACADCDRRTPQRRKLPDVRQSVTHKFSVGGAEGYLTVGLYEDGTPGEVFCKMAKEGSTLSGLMDGWAIACSMALQYGVPPEALFGKLSGMSFEPCGHTGHPDIHFAKSVLDYIARWILHRFAEPIKRASMPPERKEEVQP